MRMKIPVNTDKIVIDVIEVIAQISLQCNDALKPLYYL